MNLSAISINNMAERLLAQGRNSPRRCGLHQGVEMVGKLVPIALREFRCLGPKPRLMLNLDVVRFLPHRCFAVVEGIVD